MDTLARLNGLVVIDEVQRQPGLVPLLRVLIDRSDAPGQCLLLGSASPALLRQAGESLLGRVETIQVGGFDLAQTCGQEGRHDQQIVKRLWLRGGFLPIPGCLGRGQPGVARPCHRQSCGGGHATVRRQYRRPAMLRFWRMLAH